MSKSEFWQRAYLTALANNTAGVNPEAVANRALNEYEKKFETLGERFPERAIED